MKRIILCVTCLILALLSCSINDSFSGTAESGNAKVVGLVVNESGIPAENVLVSLIPEKYNSVTQGALPDSLKDTTDGSGLYCITVPEMGYYNVLAKHPDEGTGLLVRDIYFKPDTTVNCNGTLHAQEKLILSVPENSSTATGYVYIQGTPEYLKIAEGSNQVIFDSIPTGFMPPVYYIDTDDIANTVLLAKSDEVEIVAGSITYHGTLPQWAYRKKVYINTTQSGANITSHVVNFPLLVRLDNSNFSFEKAKANGQDIRFTKQNNTLVPYEIEKWDSAGMQAEIWVKLDTIYGNNDTQFVNLYWGNNSAVDSSTPSQVFDTTDGFCGVWHFPPADIFSDATANTNDGTNFGSIEAPGIIGEGRAFDGLNEDDYISTGTSSTLRPAFRMTLQAWVKPSGIPIVWDGIVGNFCNDGTEQSGYFFAYNESQWRFFLKTELMADDDWEDNPGSSSVPVKSWSHLTGTYDGNTIKFYLNGTLVASENKTGNIDWDFQPEDFVIGMYKDFDEAYEYGGSLDEIRVLKTACSDDWIKLCYETQKAGSKVVELR